MTTAPRTGMIQLESLPGQPMVPFEAVLPMLSQAARLEIELRATQLVATQALGERGQLESRIEMLTSQAHDDPGEADSKSPSIPEPPGLAVVPESGGSPGT